MQFFNIHLGRNFLTALCPKQALAPRGATEHPAMPRRTSPILRLLGLSADRQGPHLNRSVPRGRNPRSNGDGFVQVGGIHKEIAAQLLFGFREWAIGDHAFAVSHARTVVAIVVGVNWLPPRNLPFPERSSLSCPYSR